MKKLTIDNFLNEMSYDLRMDDMDNVVLKYQEVLIEYFLNNQYIYKERKKFNEVCENVRSDKYLRSIERLIEISEDILTDMSYVLVTSSNFPYVETDTKHKSMELSYKLREPEIRSVVKNNEIASIVTTLSVWSIRSYETTSFFRTKCAEQVIKMMPGALYHGLASAYIKPSAMSKKAIFSIFNLVIPDLKIDELLPAFFKSDFPKKSKYSAFASRLRAFLYEICALVDAGVLHKALRTTCDSMMRFNERHQDNKVSFTDKYLNYKMLELLGNDESGLKAVNSERAANILKTGIVIKSFRLNNTQYSELF